MNIRTLINICGAARSGTTMLDLMLGNADNAFSCGEVYAWFRPWRKHHFSFSCSCGEGICPVWQPLKDIPEDMFHKKALEHTGAQFIIDSSKELCWVIDNQEWCKKNNIKVINLVIWKSPLELAYSHWKRGETLSFWRDQFVGYYGRFLEAGIPFVAVSYDALVSNPAAKLKQICGFVNMPYFEGKEEFWQTRHHHLFGSLGTRRQMEAGKSEIGPTEFPPEFRQHINDLTQEIEHDTKVLEIISRLQDMDVAVQSPESIDWNEPVHRPWWYYYLRMKQLVYRHFPRSSPEMN